MSYQINIENILLQISDAPDKEVLVHNDNTSLMNDLCIDSLQFITLVLKLEECGLNIPDEMLLYENFETIGKIKNFIETLKI